MKAIIATESGGPEVLKLEEFPAPSPGPTQLVGQCQSGRRQSCGHYPAKGRLSHAAGESEILGLEIAGTG